MTADDRSIFELLASLCDETISSDEMRQLDRLICADAAARRLYIEYLDLHARLSGQFQRIDVSTPLNASVDSFVEITNQPERELVEEDGIGQRELPLQSGEVFDFQSKTANTSPISPIIIGTPATVPSLPFGFLGSAYHGTANFFAQEIPFACLMATLFMIAGGIIGSLITKEHYTQMPGLAASAERSYASGGAAAGASDLADKAVPSERAAAKSPWIGEITGKVDCVWANNKTAPVWHKFGMNDKFELKSGLVEITYYSGAKVILQGPCTYEVDSAAGGYLSLGKLTARVEKKGAGKAVASGQWSVASDKAEGGGRRAEETLATNHSPLATNSNPQSPIPNPPSPAPRPLSPVPLFAVRTPTAVVTDLGTEFGVEVPDTGETKTHVFQGSIRMTSQGASGAEPQTVLLAAGQSAHLNLQGVVASYPKTESAVSLAKVFTRKLPSLTQRRGLSLADIVAGGDGLGLGGWGGINAEDGTGVSMWHGRNITASANRYSPVTQNPLIDGVFIPNSARGPVQLDSAGHTFDGFKANGASDGPIWSGVARFTGMTGDGRSMSPGAVLGGIDYGAPGRSLLDMAANKGVTFDLDAIRAAHPSWRLGRFLAKAGNTEIATTLPGQDPVKISADLWVFVDGQVRFSKTRVNRKNGAFAIDIPFTDSDRFLTLAATDGGNGITADWIVFGDPRLELVESEPPVQEGKTETPTQAKGGN